MKIEKDAVTFEMPDADFVAKFGMQAAADMVLDFHFFHPQLPFLYDARQLAAFLSTSRQKLLLLCAAHGGSISPRHHPQA